MSEQFSPPQSPIGLLPETARDPWLARLFSPIPTAGEARQQETPESYDFLLKGEGQYQAGLDEAHQKAALRESEERKYTIVTDQSRAQAAERLNRAITTDAAIGDIVNGYPSSKTSLDLVDSIRSAPELRYKLGEYLLLEKLPRRLHMMPDRVLRNTEKSPKHRGYDSFGRLASQEYTVLLALAMLDGTFQDSGADRIHKNAAGQVELGQHRAAAEELLS